MEMTPETFGAMALELFNSATIPTAAIDTAMQFREIAKALAEGRMALQDQVKK